MLAMAASYGETGTAIDNRVQSGMMSTIGGMQSSMGGMMSTLGERDSCARRVSLCPE